MKFRWEWVLIPAVVLLMVYILTTINPACGWAGLMSALGVVNTDEYSRMAALAVFLAAAIAVR